MSDPIPLRTDQKTPATVAALLCPNMFAIASGKGGVGKTWFSITLCQALSKRGKRVLLFDGDLGLANVDIQLGLTPQKDLGDVIDGKIPLSGAIATAQEAGFDILAGRSGSGSLATLSAQRVADLRGDLIALAGTYDFIAVDLGAGVDRSVRQMAGPAATTFVVLTDEPTSLTDAYAFIKLARAANPNVNVKIIVNMASSASNGRQTYDTVRKACEGFLQFTPPLAGIIRRDAKVREAIRAQMPLLTRSPNSPAAEDVEAVARHFVNP